jgi:hypothetical protein
MTKLKRSVHVGAILSPILPVLALSIHVLVSPNAVVALEQASPVQISSQAQMSLAYAADVLSVTSGSNIHEFRFLIAQTEIPDVLIPSVAPSAGSTLPEQSATQQPPQVETSASNNNTAATHTRIDFSLEKFVGSISPIFVIVLIPILFVIGALFYFFFMGDQDRTPREESTETDAESNITDEYEEWREL